MCDGKEIPQIKRIGIASSDDPENIVWKDVDDKYFSEGETAPERYPESYEHRITFIDKAPHLKNKT